MKNFILTKLIFLMAFVTISMISCIKSDISSNSDTYLFVPKASITDMGPVNDSTRKLLVILRGLKYELTNDYGTFLQSGSLIQVGFFTNKDGIIPAGEYIYSDSTFEVPFTFSDAFIEVGGGFIGIANGSVTVSSDGPTYTLFFKCGLSDGESITATFNGTMTYSDYFNK